MAGSELEVETTVGVVGSSNASVLPCSGYRVVTNAGSGHLGVSQLHVLLLKGDLSL